MSPSDKKIIDLHPEASAYDLFNTYGLSKKGYDELSSKVPDNLKLAQDHTKPLIPEKVVQKATQPSNLLVPEKIIETNNGRVSPVLSPFPVAPNLQSGGDVVLITIGTGKRSPMTRYAADRLVKRHPTMYKIA